MTQFGPSGFAIRAMQLGLQIGSAGIPDAAPPATRKSITPGAEGLFDIPIPDEGYSGVHPTSRGRTASPVAGEETPRAAARVGAAMRGGGAGATGMTQEEIDNARLQEELDRARQGPPRPTAEDVRRVGELSQQITGEADRLRGNLFPGLDPKKAFDVMARAGSEWKPPPDWQRTMAMSTPMQSFVQPNTIQGIIGMRRERERLMRPYIG
jgi:hypothetical protein